ncbi:MarR family winged helix-turn-helix transcriptional regulator [Neotabrizicola sp. sgz301269]|uniref:MarR family winged helix-turn-helix transcriptional regulator n=1 Tax=Neotabrizicola sp. sgz301269 TaxID=3276282 RepID=UPI00376FE43D
MILKDASRAMRREFEARTTDWGLSATQWRLLAHILNDGPMTQAALADLLDVEPMSVSRLLDRMEAADWVRRCPHPEDRRARIVEPTAKAAEAAPQVRAIAEGIYDEALEPLTEEERRIFHRALLCVIETLNAPKTEPQPDPTTAVPAAAAATETLK